MKSLKPPNKMGNDALVVSVILCGLEISIGLKAVLVTNCEIRI